MVERRRLGLDPSKLLQLEIVIGTNRFAKWYGKISLPKTAERDFYFFAIMRYGTNKQLDMHLQTRQTTNHGKKWR